MPNVTTGGTKRKSALYPLLGREERLLIWEKARGLWKKRKPEPIRELKKTRREWDRSILP